MGFFDFINKKKSKEIHLQVSVQNLADEMPTEKQIAYAKALGIPILPSMTRNEVSELISNACDRKKPPADWQMQRANKMGIQMSPDITYLQLEELLNKAEFDKPPTHQQLKKAKAFGVSITPNLTYGQLGSLLDEAEWAQPANAEQTELCDKVGICLPVGTNRRQANEHIEKAKNDPQYKLRFQKLQDEEEKEETEEEDREMREKYGDKLMDDFYRWEKISDEGDGHYLMIFRRGKEVVVEVVELDYGPEIVDGKKPFVKMALLLPKKERQEKDHFSLEWEIEKEIHSSDILHFQKIDRQLSDCYVMFDEESKDFAAYKKMIEKGKEFSKRFTLSN